MSFTRHSTIYNMSIQHDGCTADMTSREGVEVIPPVLPCLESRIYRKELSHFSDFPLLRLPVRPGLLELLCRLRPIRMVYLSPTSRTFLSCREKKQGYISNSLGASTPHYKRKGSQSRSINLKCTLAKGGSVIHTRRQL